MGADLPVHIQGQRRVGVQPQLADGKEHRLGPGDMGFFPAGSSCQLRITNHVRKFAMVRTTLPRPIVFALRVWKRLKRLVSAPAASPLTRAVLVLAQWDLWGASAL